MYSNQEKHILSNPKFLSYFIPQKLKEEKIFPVTAFSFEKNEIEIESFQYSFSELQQNFLVCLENRFWLYGNTPFFENQKYSLCFQSLDCSNKTLEFSKKKRKLCASFSFVSALRQREEIFRESKNQVLMKSRLLRLTKGGFVSSCVGNPAYIIRSSSFYKYRKHNSYQGLLSLNLQYYGLLSFFSLIRFNKKFSAFSRKYQRKFLSGKAKFYYLKNRSIKYLILLGKPKTISIQMS